MKATFQDGAAVASKIVLELTIEEARALNRQLGTDSSRAMLERGVTRAEADLCYSVYYHLDDAVAESLAAGT